MAAAHRTEYFPLDGIEPALTNPKSHSDAEIRASLARFGYVEPGLIDDRTGRLVAGHGRLDALRALRAEGEPAPSGIQVRADGMWLVPVTRGWSSRSDLEAHAAGVALNRLSEVGGWDRAALGDLLDQLAETDHGLDGLGWTTGDLDDLLAEIGPADQTPPAERPPTAERQVQGLREVALMFSTAEHQEWGELLATLRRRWKLNEAPAIALRALREAAKS